MEVDKPAKKVKGQAVEASSADEESSSDEEEEVPKNKKKGKGACHCLYGLLFVSSCHF